ncbi:MAG: septum formation initiator family protein [Bacteroidales bacterium]|nr:septum formation initiator family protein [Bacteroidales bacterium]MDD3200918.1 septum formation initiator family protein [Bacteroidales bacterium]
MSLFGSIKNFWNNLHSKKIVRILLNKYTLITLVFIIYAFLINNNNLKEFFNVNSKIERQREQMKELQMETDANNEKIHQLQSSKDSLEKFAREQYNFVQDSEDLYIIEEPQL